MFPRWIVVLIVPLGFMLGCGVNAQQQAGSTVTSAGGTANQVAKFSGNNTIVDSAITEINGNVGIGVLNPTFPLHVNGDAEITGQPANALHVTGSSTGRFGQDGVGTYVSSDSAGNTLRFLTNNGSLNAWMQIDSKGKTTFSNNLNGIDFGEVVMAPDNADIVQGVDGQAGPQMHFRLSRAYCDKRTGSLQSPSDQAKYFCVPGSVTIDDTHPPSSTPNQDFLIVPYWYGMNIEYPGVIEFNSTDVGVHVNRRGCSPAETNWLNDDSCQSGGHLWAEDNTDTGGVFSTSYAVMTNNQVDRSQSFTLIASDLYDHSSHGDMLFAIRDPNDNFRFQFGASGVGGADDPNSYKSFTKARIDSTGKGFFDGGTQTGSADFAESIGVTGTKTTFEPGDVLVIDTNADRRVSLSRDPYSTLVAGIYSTKPGVVGTFHASEDPALAGEIPMAIVGIVPCKVTTENGPIARGDLLVTSSTPGYAMRGSESSKFAGAILGKALQPLATGRGEIEVLVTLQ